MPRFDETHTDDVRESYAKLQSAAERHESEWGTALKICKKLQTKKWAAYADKAATQGLKVLTDMRATAENSRWQDELVLRQAAFRVLDSAAENHPKRPGRKTPDDAEKVYGQTEAGAWEKDKAEMARFRDALAKSPSDDEVKAVLKGSKDADD